MIKKIGRTVLYFLYIFLVFEIFARVVYAIPYTSERLRGIDDATWKNRWVAGQKEGKKMYYSFDDYDATKGWKTKPNVRNLEVFKDTVKNTSKILNTNNRGIRGTRNFDYEKPADKTRILLIGDSFTFGDEVSDDENFAHYIQTMVPNAEVINMGVHGYGHDQILIYLKEEGIKYNPDIVMLGFISKDLRRNLLSFRDFAKPYFKLNNDKLELHNTPVPRPEKILKYNWMRLRVLDLFGFAKLRAWQSSGKFFEKQKEIATPILEEIATTINSIGAKAIFTFLPEGDEIKKEIAVVDGEGFLKSFCDANDQVTFFSTTDDVLAAFAAGRDIGVKGHWTPIGHEVIAQSIMEQLQKENLINIATTKEDSLRVVLQEKE